VDEKKILVIGASGALGQNICRELGYLKDIKFYVGDYKPRRGSRTANKWNADETVYVDAAKEDSIYFAVNGMDAVIAAVSQHEPLIQKVCYQLNIPCIDANSRLSFARKTDELNFPKASPSIMMAGLIPGLSGVLIHELYQSFETVKQIDVFFVQNIHANVGRNGVVDMFDIISEPLPHKKRAFNNTRHIDIDEQNFELKQIEHGERKFLMREFNLKKLNYWTGWNNKAFTKGFSFLVQTDLLSQFVPLITSLATKKRTKDETVYLKVSAKGISDVKLTEKDFVVKSNSDYHITAQMITLLVFKVLDRGQDNQLKGLTFPYEWLNYQDIKRFLV